MKRRAYNNSDFKIGFFWLGALSLLVACCVAIAGACVYFFGITAIAQQLLEVVRVLLLVACIVELLRRYGQSLDQRR